MVADNQPLQENRPFLPFWTICIYLLYFRTQIGWLWCSTGVLDWLGALTKVLPFCCCSRFNLDETIYWVSKNVL